MKSGHWLRIQEIFQAAVDLPAEDRLSLIQRSCDDDSTTMERVLKMLEEDSCTNGLLDHNIEIPAETDIPDPLIEKEIGPYRLLEFLGEGGMGVVYLAERTDIGGRVAIKLLRDAWLSPIRRERFEAEQKMLVRLNHPSIARLYDASATTGGTPWFVMEYVDGLPFIDYVQQKGLSTRQSLSLFRDVCEAVSHAHSHAIVHRDLKPSNILVTKEGNVKLLDFGIAKHLQITEETTQAATAGWRLFTPSYAPPELQETGTVGVFTDVYSLGVILYQMLTGQVPPSGRTTRTNTPSRVAGSSPSGRNGDISRSEWEDLDAICVKALEANPNDRYVSVDALMRDVTAFLDGRILDVRPRSTFYVTAKFVKRNKRRLMISMFACFAIVATAVFFTVRLSLARDAASRSRDLAVLNARRTAQLQQFTERLLNGGEDWANSVPGLDAGEILDRGFRDASTATNDPEIQAHMLAVLGKAYQSAGKLDKAETALKMARQRACGQSPRSAQCAEYLISEARLYHHEGRLDESQPLLQRALDIQKEVLPFGDPAFERTYSTIGDELLARQSYSQARYYYEMAISEGERHGGMSPQFADTLTSLSSLLALQGREWATAENYARRSLQINQQLFGHGSPGEADSYLTLGFVAERHGHDSEAEAYFRQTLTAIPSSGDNRQLLVHNIPFLTKALIHEGKLQEAESFLRRCVDLLRSADRKDVMDQYSVKYEFGELEYARHRLNKARRYFESALASNNGIVHTVDRDYESGFLYLARIAADQKDFVRMEKLCRSALSIEGNNDDNFLTSLANIGLGHALLKQGKLLQAEQPLLQAHSTLSKFAHNIGQFALIDVADLIEVETRLHGVEDASRYRLELGKMLRQGKQDS